jgi:hypothetical protein
MVINEASYSGELSGAKPLRRTTARLAAILRGTVALGALFAALLGIAQPVSLWWLVPALVVLVCWTAAYVWIAWTEEFRLWLVAGDLALAAFLCLAMGKLVPQAAMAGGSSWIVAVAGVAVIGAQLGGPRAASVPAALLVAGCFVVGSRLAKVGDGGINEAVTLALQAIFAAGVMTVGMRAGNAAAQAFVDLHEAQHVAELARARRADELAQLRFLHNGPLTTLSMALGAAGPRPSEVLRRSAAADLQNLPRLAEVVAHERATAVPLDERLRQLPVRVEPRLTVVTELNRCVVPEYVADAFVDAVTECLENVARHAGVDSAKMQLHDDDGSVRLVVSDAGCGFDPGHLDRWRFGLRQAVVGRMMTVGGTARIDSSTGKGVVVHLGWRHD